MATFFTDADLAGAAQFVESELIIGTRFTIGAGLVVPRWRWPNNTPGVAPAVRVYDTGGALVAGPIAFDSTTLTAWNSAGAASPLNLAAGTYDFTVNTTHYMAVAGFFAGGPVVRGDITGVQARFGNVGAAPPNGATATYYMDIDWAAAGGGATLVYPTSVALRVTPGAPTVTTRTTAAPTSVRLLATPGRPTVTTVAPPAPEPGAGGGWNTYLGVIESARQDHRVNQERLRNPVECPTHGWPLVRARGVLFCEFGGHIVTPLA